jgi:hypothetical protein
VDGSAVLVGLDRDAAIRELASRAPLAGTAEQAIRRAANLNLAGSGAAERITAALSDALSGAAR